MRYFGEPTEDDATIYLDIGRATTPVGQTCLYPACELPIADGQRGFILMELDTGQEYPVHRRCLAEWFFGQDLAAELAKTGTFLGDGGP